MSPGVGAAAQAPEPALLTFATQEPLVLKWSQVESGKSLGVCNGRRATASRVKVVATDFAFATKAPNPAGVLAVDVPPGGLRAGECEQVRVHAAPGAQIEPGEYDGELLLVSSGGGVSALQTTITSPAEKPATPAAVSDELTLSVRNTTPWDHEAEGVLLLKQPNEKIEKALRIPQSCTSSVDEEDEEARCPWLGNLYQDGHIMAVRVAGKATAHKRMHVQELRVRLRSFSHAVGDYSGTLTLTSVGGKPQPIKLKVSAKDAWGCALLALLLGTVIPLLLQLIDGRWHPRAQLRGRADALPGAYPTGSVLPSEFDPIEADPDKLNTYKQAVNDAIDKYLRSAVLVDEKSDAYLGITKALELAESDGHVLKDGLPSSLATLRGAAKKVTALLAAREVADTPRLLALAAAPLEGAQLGVGEATTRVKRAEELTPLLEAWCALSAPVLDRAVWLKALAEHDKDDPMSEADRKVLHGVGPDLFAVRQELVYAEDPADLARARAASGSAFGRIAYLGETYGVHMPARGVHPKKFHVELASVGYPGSHGKAPSLNAVVKKPAAVVSSPAIPLRLPPVQRLAWALDALALTLAVAVAVVGGLAALYFGKPFGTFDDYLAVIVVGAGGQVIVKVLLERLSVFSHDITPLKATTAATATVVVHK